MNYHPEVYSCVRRLCGFKPNVPMDDNRAMIQIKALLRRDDDFLEKNITDDEDKILTEFIRETYRDKT